MAEVTNDYAIGGDYGRSHGAGLSAGAKAFAEVSANNSSNVRAEVPQNVLSGIVANSGEHRQTNAIAFQTDRDVLSNSAQIRVEAKDNTQAILNAINNSNLLASEREARQLRDAIAANAANNANAALISQIGGMFNTAISTITNIVGNTAAVSVSL